LIVVWLSVLMNEFCLPRVYFILIKDTEYLSVWKSEEVIAV